MKKSIAVSLIFSLCFALPACFGERQGEAAAYSFCGEQDGFIISNGVIVISDNECMFYGGNLNTAEADALDDISAYKATFYSMAEGEAMVIAVDEFKNESSSELKEIDFGKKQFSDFKSRKAFAFLEDAQGEILCELKITDFEGNEKICNIELDLAEAEAE